MGRTLYRHLKHFAIPVELFAPFGTPTRELEESFLGESEAVALEIGQTSARTLGGSTIALAEILARVVRQPHHWPVGRTTFQKLAYFATEAGLPTGLQYEKGSYGPFSPGVKPLVSRLVNNGVIEETRRGPMFSVVPGRTFRDARSTYRVELEQWDDVIEKVADLILRLRTTNQAEIASSVHFVARSLATHPGTRPAEMEVLEGVLRWKEGRQPRLDVHDVALAVRSLGTLGWVDLVASPDLPVPDDELLGV